MELLFVRNIIVSVLTCYIIRQCAGQTIDACSHVESEVKLCYQLYQPFTYTDLNQSWTQNCQNVECYLQCMVDAIRDCDSTDRYFTYDINVLIVSYRAACDKFELNINALLSCELYNTTCLIVSGALELAQSAAVFYNSSRYVEYKQAQCKFLQLFTDCLQSRGSGECTTELSDYYGELLRVSASLKGCGHLQDQPYFTTYGGPPKCITPYTFETSSTPQTTTASIPTTSTLLSSTTPQTTTTSIPTTSTLLSSTTPQTTTTSIPTTSTLLSSAPQTTTTSIPTTSTLLFSTPQTTTTSIPTTSTLLFSTPQTTTTFLPTTTILLSSTPQTTTTSTSLPTTKKTTASPLGCSESMIAASLSKCFTISLDEISRSSTYDLLTSYCGDLECNIQCYINAVGKCYTEDQFFVYDTEVYKVTSRAFCNDMNETMFAVLNCQMTYLSCLTELTNSIQTVLSAFNAQDYTTYRQTYCTALTSFQSCVAFAASGSCTSNLARHALDFYVASTSYWKCGLQNHEYFTTYGEDVTCSAVKTMWGIVILIPFLAMLLDLRVFW